MDVCYCDLSFRYLTRNEWFRQKTIVYQATGNDTMLTGPFWPRNSSWGFNRYIQCFTRHVLSRYKDQKPDVIHAHTYIGAIVANQLKYVWNTPVILTEHYTGWMDNSIPRAHRILGLEAYALADELNAVGSQLASILSNAVTRNVGVTPNFVDTDLFCFRDNESPDVFQIIAIGDLIERKRIDLLLKAFAQVVKSVDQAFSLTIVGDGPLMSSLAELSQSLKINENVLFVGQKSETEIAHLLSFAQVLIHTSKVESFGIVMIEALASGVPVIAFANGGAQDIIEPKNGILLINDNIPILVETMLYMAKEYTSYDRMSISKDAHQRYGAEQASKQMSEMYQRIAPIN